MIKKEGMGAKMKEVGIPGYEKGIILLVAASVFVVALLVMIETSRAKPAPFRFTKPVEVERIPPEEARGLGVLYRKH